MNIYVNLIIFIVITIAYFMFGKKNTVYSSLSEEDIKKNYNNSIIYLVFYFIAVLISQITLNVINITQTCNGSIIENIGSGSLLAFIPWFLIFGSVLSVIFIFPGLKSVFSNVIGYFAVSSGASTLLTSLLNNTDIESQINEISDNKEKIQFKKTTELILKICSDKSILINEMNPSNYDKMFESLKILFNPDVVNNGNIEDYKEKLRKLVFLKDNIGEFFWYLYTAVFLVSLVSYNTSARGCSQTLSSMQDNYDEFTKQAEEIQNNTINQLYT
jgi:hypothetical protein